MTTLQEKQAEAKAKMQQQNPSNSPGQTKEERKRIPLGVPRPKLAVPEIPGYHTHWFRGTPQRLAQAQQAWYEFVDPSEIDVNNLQIGGDATKTGNTDMGSRVSVVDGAEEGGQAIRLFLMKQKMEYFLEDRKILGDRNDSIAEALTASYRQGTVGGAAPGESKEDLAARYVDRSRSKVPALFRKKGG